MAEVYIKYEEELKSELESITLQIEKPIDSRQEFKVIRLGLTECQKSIKLMQAELSAESGPAKAGRVQRLREYRQKFEQLKKDLYHKENDYDHQEKKDELLSTRPNSSEVIRSGDRSLQVTEELKGSVKVMYESLQISENMGEQLHNQTGRLIATKGKLGNIRDDLNRSERKIKSMMVRIRRNKFVLGSVILVIVLALVVILVSYLS